MSTCYCGHVDDEHLPNRKGQPVECDLCDCTHFEKDEDASEEEDTP